MCVQACNRLPKHLGVIPDGNRRWALGKGLLKQDGYQHGLDPGFELYKICLELGIEEMTFYGFTVDNTKRPSEQTYAFQKACVDAALKLADMDAELLVVGNSQSPLFPRELLPFTQRTRFGRGLMKVNFLVNYGWNWDIHHSFGPAASLKKDGTYKKDHLLRNIASKEISRIDLIIRWGGRRRLSGFLPIQSIYADFYVVDDMWPDFQAQHVYDALDWYGAQDVTLGG